MSASEEKFAKVIDLEKLAGDVPEEVKRAIQTHGFDKLAAAMHGVPEIDERTAAQLIGTNFFLKRAENRLVSDGLAALVELRKE